MNDDRLRELFKRLKDGDSDALCEIYDGLSKPIYTVALRITSDRVLAEDAVQELFVKLYRLPPDSSIAKPRAYLFRAARNMALDMLKAAPAHDSIDSLEDVPAPEREDHSDVTAALAKLPEEQRSVVTLHINAGFKFREIAQITGAPLGTVLWRYRKALAAMKEELSGGAR